MMTRYLIDDVNISPRVYFSWHQHAKAAIEQLRDVLTPKLVKIDDEYVISVNGRANLVVDVYVSGRAYCSVVMPIPPGEWALRERMASA